MKFQTTILFLLIIFCNYSSGNPQGHSVTAGDVDIQTDGLNLNITASDRAIIEWQDFSIDAGETTRFIQPSSSAAVLNQVTSNIPSSIYGNLIGNGNVYLTDNNKDNIVAAEADYIYGFLDLNRITYLPKGFLLSSTFKTQIQG